MKKSERERAQLLADYLIRQSFKIVPLSETKQFILFSADTHGSMAKRKSNMRTPYTSIIPREGFKHIPNRGLSENLCL